MKISFNEVNVQKIKEWKENIQNLLFGKSICGVCLREEQDLQNWDDVYHIQKHNVECSLKDVLSQTFGYNVTNILPSTYFCNKCMTTVLKAYILLKEIKYNQEMLENLKKNTDKVSENLEESEENKQELFLKIDNIKSLKAPGMVTKKNKSGRNFNEIILCKIVEDTFDTSDSEVNDTDYELITKSNSKYECPYCEKKSNLIQSFKKHCQNHSKETAFKCCICTKRFTILEKLIEHRNFDHAETISFCNTCQIILNDAEDKEHINEHTNEVKTHSCPQKNPNQTNFRYIDNKQTDITCQHCFGSFTNKLKLNHHICLYKCLECKEDCIHQKYLLSYREQHMRNERDFTCIDCEFKYTARNQLICHVNEEHLKHFPYLCDHCGEKFASEPLFTIHMYKNHADVTQLKLQPFKYYSAKESLKLHPEKQLILQIQCRFCSKIFSTISNLNVHIKRHHPDEMHIKTTVYQCTMCTADFDYSRDYLKHIEAHPKGTKHVCRICRQCFKLKNNYLTHVRKHQIKYDRECPICFKKYTKHSISRHMRQHKYSGAENSERLHATIMCDVCGALLSNKKSLIKHIQRHKEERQCSQCTKYVTSVFYNKHVRHHKCVNASKIKLCSDCDYSTRFATCLEAHINRHHLKVRPFQCDVCSKTFYSDYTLKGHKLTHVNQRPEHYCEICGKKFISKKALMLHTRLHTGEKPYPCELCELSFLSASRRKAHKIRKHFEPSVECQLCQKKLYTQSDLRRHMGDCHDYETKRKRAKKKQPENDNR